MALVDLDISNNFGEPIDLGWQDVEALAPTLVDLVEQLEADRQAGLLGFLDLPDANFDRLTLAARESASSFDTLTVLGIGGSSLGARALYEALDSGSTGLPRKVRFNENVDPDEFSRLLSQTDWERTQWAVVTKSGSTIETWSTFLIVWDELINRFGEDGARERVVVITDPERGPLRAFAEANQLASFEVPPSVGGRFSVLSAVGLYPLAFAGVEIEALLKGAQRGRSRSLSTAVLDNPAAVIAATQFLHYQKGRSIVVLMPYASSLYAFAEWFCQLWAESLGKRVGDKRVGPTPISALGVRDQHSQLQLYMEGPWDKNVLFIVPKEFKQAVKVPMVRVAQEIGHLCGKDLSAILAAELAGTRQALYEEGCPSSILTMRNVSEEALGALLMTFEIATAVAGGLFEVDPYNQPGVELGKRYAHGLLGRKRESHYAASLGAAEGARTRRQLTI